MTADVFLRASLNLINERLSAHGRNPRRRGDHVDARCPAHEDHDPSLSIDWDAVLGGVLVCCHAGCSVEAVASSLSMTLGDLYDQPRAERVQAAHRHHFAPEAIHDYAEAHGEIVGRVHRERCACGEKKIWWDRPDGAGGWEAKSPDVKPLYNLLDLLLAVRSNADVVVVEGESSVDALSALGIVATTNPGGSGPGKWRQMDTDTFRGVGHVTIVADNDFQGYAHAARVRAALRRANVDVSVKRGVVRRKGADIVDHLAEGHLVAELEDVPEVLLTDGIEAAKEKSPADALRRNMSDTLARAQRRLDSSDEVDVDAVFGEIIDFYESLERAEERTAPHLAQLPVYPAALLPDPLGELVRQGRKAGLQQSLVGGSGLGVLGTVAGNSVVEVYPNGTWREQSALWVPNIAPPGAGKSPAMEFAYRLLMDLDADSRADYVKDLNDWYASKCDGEAPEDLTRVQEDLTQEAVVRWLAAGDGVGGIAPDELTNFLSSLGKYRKGGSDGGDRARWLSNWALKQWPYVRVTAHINLLVRRPVVSICGGLQPGLHYLLGPEDDGFRARWLPHMATLDSTLTPSFEDCSTPLWDAAVRCLYESRAQRTWTLNAPDGKAFKIWSEARDRWKRQAAEGSESASTSGALSKADIQAARVALALAEGAWAMGDATDFDPRQQREIPEQCMVGAVAIVDYTLDCWRTLPGRTTLTLSVREEKLSTGVDQLAAWLEGRAEKKASRRDLLRSAVAGARKKDTLDALLAEYEAIYPGSIQAERTGSRGHLAQVVYAPRRAPRIDGSSTGAIVSADSSPDTAARPSASGVAGQSAARADMESVGGADSSEADNSALTVSPMIGTATPTGKVIL